MATDTCVQAQAAALDSIYTQAQPDIRAILQSLRDDIAHERREQVAKSDSEWGQAPFNHGYSRGAAWICSTVIERIDGILAAMEGR